jgi:hypothetical protein
MTQYTQSPSWLTRERAIIGGGLILALVVVVFSIIAILNPPANPRAVLIDGVESFAGLVTQHVATSVDYPQTPPVGGPHNAVWQNCGVYTEPVANEHAVHSLEHGTVWITYQPDLPASQLQTLQDITRRSSHRLLSPYPGIDSPIILSAWGFQLRLESADDPRLNQFIQKYEQGPSTPERGAVCSGGQSRTLSQLTSG